MTRTREQQYRQIAARSKYQRLYTHLCGLAAQEWRTSFSEIESLLGFALPASARLHRPWWSNQPAGNGHSQALSWSAAGWETAEVDMEAETLLLQRKPTAGGPADAPGRRVASPRRRRLAGRSQSPT